MKIDFGAILYALDGEPFERVDGDKKDNNNKPVLIPMTLGHVCAQATLGMIDQDKTANGVEKYERWQLAGKVIKDIEIDLTHEEIVKLKERVGLVYGPAHVGPVYSLLEDDDIAKKDKK